MIALTFLSFTGIDQFCSDIHKMIGYLPGLYWRICWKFLTPTFLLVIILSICLLYLFSCPLYITPTKIRNSFEMQISVLLVNITLTCPFNVYPLTAHFEIIKLGFTGVYTFFLFLL